MWEDGRVFLATLGRDLSISNPYFGRATHDIHGAREHGNTAAGFPDILMFKFIPESMADIPYISYTSSEDHSTLLRSGTLVSKSRTSAKSMPTKDLKALPEAMKNLALESINRVEMKPSPQPARPNNERHTRSNAIKGSVLQESEVTPLKLDKTLATFALSPSPEGKTSQVKEEYVKVQAMCGEVKTYWSYQDEIYERIVNGEVAPDGHFDWSDTSDSADLLKQVGLLLIH